MLAVQLVAAVHRPRRVPLVFADASDLRLRRQIRQAVGGNRRGIEEEHRAAVRLAFALRELEQRQRALDVDLVRGDRRELGARRQQRREVEDQIDLELGEHALEQGAVGDRAGELALDQAVQRRVERREIDR